MKSEQLGLAYFESIQNNFSLLNRRFLDELARVCRNAGFHTGGRFAAYMDSSNVRQRAMARRFVNEKTLASTAKYVNIAKEAGIHPVIAWSKQFDFVASTIIGASNAKQLDPHTQSHEHDTK